MSNIAAIPVRDFPGTTAGDVWREELLAKIEQLPAGAVLVSAMAGYGKSVLFNQVAMRNQAVVMCPLSYSDNDLPFFVKHLVTAMERLVPSPEGSTGDHPFARLMELCRLAATHRLTLVFDNCQVITNEEVSRALQLFMTEAEYGFKVILGSRYLPAFAAKLVLEGRCLVLGRSELALSEAEIGQLVHRFFAVEDRELARYLRDFTGGWAAGVLFCLRRQPSRGGLPPAWEELVDRGLIRKYLAFEVLPSLPEPVARFVQRASILNPLSIEVCDAILETGDARECLGFLAENQIFVEESPEEATTFRWIDIFRKALADHLETVEKAAIAEKTVDYYLRRKLHLEAMEFALKNGKPDLICRVLTICGESLLEQQQFELLGACAQALEKGGEKLEAGVYGLLAQYYYATGDYAKMDYNFNMADSMFGKENIYSAQRSLYRALLRYETDPPKYLKMINNVLFYLDEYNLKLPFLLPREQQLLEKLKGRQAVEEKGQDQKPLKVKQFGPFKVIVVEDGYELTWRTKKGGELLAYLISLNGKSVERSHLFDVIWPDELPNNPVAMLHNMIYNIRKELSAYNLEKLIQYKNKGYSIDMSLVECDGETVTQLCAAIARKDLDTLLENEAVLLNYWGEYLENMTGLWVMERKEYYNKMFVTGSLLLGDFYYDSGIYEKALVFLENALKIDVYSERIIEKMLNCYAKLGKLDKVRAKYEEFCNLLASELEIGPSDDLQSAYQRCMQRKV